MIQPRPQCTHVPKKTEKAANHRCSCMILVGGESATVVDRSSVGFGNYSARDESLFRQSPVETDSGENQGSRKPLFTETFACRLSHSAVAWEVYRDLQHCPEPVCIRRIQSRCGQVAEKFMVVRSKRDCLQRCWCGLVPQSRILRKIAQCH